MLTDLVVSVSFFPAFKGSIMTPIEDGLTPDMVCQGGESQRSPRLKKGHPRRLALKVSLFALVIALITVGFGGLLARQVTSVRGQLEYAVELVPQLRSELGSGNLGSAQLTFKAMQKEISAAHSTTKGPLWKSATFIPVIGSNFTAVREVAASAEDITTRAIPSLIDRYDSLSWEAVSLIDGRIDVTELEEAAPSISAAANTVRLSYQRMSSIDLSGLFPQLAQPVRAATEELEGLSDILDMASSTAKLLPGMLGAEGARNYLVLVQNSAEVRATGGIPGALALLHTDDGHVSLGEQTSAGALGVFRPMVDVDPEQVAVYTGRLGTQMQNVNLTPHFPTAAQTAKLMWEQRHPGQKVDGVLALDPAVLSHLLEATGPVDLVDYQVLDLIRSHELPASLTTDSVVPTLLSDVYREIEDPEIQDAYFAAVAGRVFSAFTEGQGSAKQLIRALRMSTNENRLYLWSSHTNEQSIIASTPMHGAVTGPDSGGAAFGVYFNDGTGAKMDYYARRSVQLLKKCQSGGYGEYTVRVTVTNNAPEDAATSLPSYVTGNKAFGVEPGRILTNYVVYGPSQAFVETATVDGQSVPVSSGRHGQRPVGTVPLELGPGETATIDMVFSSVVQNSEPRLRVTPSIQPGDDVILPFESESCG